MKIAAFLQLYNEFENGHLIRCLENCQKWATDIFIYDDCSTDSSRDAYLKYTSSSNIIFGKHRSFDTEIFHKKQLLELCLRSNPNWIAWIDGDAVFSREITNNCVTILREHNAYDGLRIPYLNLWRHPAFYRTDNLFYGLQPLAFWKNNGRLHYNPKKGLHGQQFPDGMDKIVTLGGDKFFLHYGFASENWIVRKYLTYKSYGQNGWSLDRLIDENGLTLVKVAKDLYPEELVPSDYDRVVPPEPISYDKYRLYESWEQYRGINT